MFFFGFIVGVIFGIGSYYLFIVYVEHDERQKISPLGIRDAELIMTDHKPLKPSLSQKPPHRNILGHKP